MTATDGTEPQDGAWTRSDFTYLAVVATLVPLAVIGAVQIVFGSTAAERPDASTWGSALTALLALASVVAVVGAIPLARIRRARRLHRDLLRSTDALEDRTQETGPFGLTTRVRGRLDGVWVSVTRAGVEVEVGSRRTCTIEPSALVATADSELEPAVREAAVLLRELGAKVHVDEHRARVPGVPVGRALAAARAAITLARARALVQGATRATACPYCKGEVASRESEGTLRCPSCDVIHHTGCWKEHGGCSVYGCSRTPAGERRPER